MQFSSLHVLAIFAVGTFAMPNNFETRDLLENRGGCKADKPACNGGHVAGKTNCRCKGQVEPCDLWTCPSSNGVNAVVRFPALPFLAPRKRIRMQPANKTLVVYRWPVANRVPDACGSKWCFFPHRSSTTSMHFYGNVAEGRVWGVVTIQGVISYIIANLMASARLHLL